MKIIKALWNFITSLFFVVVCVAILGLMASASLINPIVVFSISIPAGALLFCLVLRKIGKWAEKSIIFSEVFTFLTSYGIKSYMSNGQLVDKDIKLTSDTDYKNIILVLKSEMGFTKVEAKQAADYAIEQMPTARLEDKIKTALQYLGENKELVVGKN